MRGAETEYYNKLGELHIYLHELAVCRVRLERLDALGVPDGSVIFSTYNKSHVCTNGEISEYTYTNSYLYIDHCKYYISKKIDRSGDLGDVNDPNNERGNIVLRGRLTLRMKIRSKLKSCKKDARLICGILNSSRPRGMKSINLDKAIEAEYMALLNSDQYMSVRLHADNELAEADAESMNASRPDFTNEIYIDSSERLRSKNELIAALCLREIGFPYMSEPQYSGHTNYCADFRIAPGISSDDYIYVEIAGMMDSADYRRKIEMKRRLASEYGMRLIIIDMTDYLDKHGKRQTRLRYDKLKKIFLDIYTGKQACRGEIVKAY